MSTSPSALEPQPIRAGCPADDADTRVSVQELEEGGALVFTNPDGAIDLRRRVKALDLPTEEIGDPDPDKIRNGIRLVFGAEDPAKVGVLHEALRRYAEGVADRCGLSLAPPKPEPQRATRPRAGESKPAVKPAASPAAKPAPTTKTPPKPVKPAKPEGANKAGKPPSATTAPAPAAPAPSRPPNSTAPRKEPPKPAPGLPRQSVP